MELATIYLVIEWSLRLLALIVVPRRRTPSSGTAWLLVIFLVPVPGWVAFAALGNYKLPKVRRDIQTRINQRIDEQLENIKQSNRSGGPIIDPVLPQKYQSLETLTQEYGRLPSLAANSLDIITDYNVSIARITDGIKKAKSLVYIQSFALALDDTTEPLFEALKAAKQRGVDIRVLFDSWGSRRYPRRKEMVQLLDNAGIPFQAMLPIRFPGPSYVRPDLRNHRKLVVIDNAIAYTGSQNLIDRHYNRSDDISFEELVVQLTGPVVLELSALFTTDWISEGGGQPDHDIVPAPETPLYSASGSIMQVLPSGPGFPDENNLKVFTHLMHRADRKITIVNPYFVPPESLLSAILSAATRGVQVRLINSEAIDQWMVGYAQRSFYDMLLEAGVEVYLYKKPNLLHSKVIVVDDEVAIIGSSNMDMRSFELDLELSVICYDETIAKQVQAKAELYRSESKQLSLSEWRKRPIYRQILENLARLTSALQ